MKVTLFKLIIDMVLLGCFIYLKNVSAPAHPLALNFIFKTGLYFIFYHVLNQPHTADLIAYYTPQGNAALAGDLPHRDFSSSYGAFFPYLFGFINNLLGYDGWYLFLILVDTFTFRLILGRMTSQIGVKYNLLYWFWILNPLIFWNTIINGQQQILIAMIGILAIQCNSNGRTITGLAFILLGALLTKIMMLIYIPSIILRGQTGNLIKNASVFACMFMFFVTVHLFFDMNFLIGLKEEAGRVTPGSLFFWVHSCFSAIPITALNVTSILTASIIPFLYYRKMQPMNSNLGVNIATITLIIFFSLGPRVYTSYYIMLLPLLASHVIIFNHHIKKILLHGMIISTLAPVEGSLFFALGMPTIITLQNIYKMIPLFLCDAAIIYCNIVIIINVLSTNKLHSSDVWLNPE